MMYWLLLFAAGIICWYLVRRGQESETSHGSRGGVDVVVKVVRGSGYSAPDESRLPQPMRAPDGDDKGRLEYHIGYADADGVVTERDIVVTGMDRSYDGTRLFITANCSLRQDSRTFRADRILSARKADGEIIPDPVDYFSRISLAVGVAGPMHGTVMRDARFGLDVLVWIARADRDLAESEVDAVIDYIGERQKLSRRKSVADWNRALARIAVMDHYTTMNNALGSVSRMKFDGQERELVQEYAWRIATLADPWDEKAVNRYRKIFPD